MAWKPEKKLESRKLILQAAAYLFTHKGFDDVTIDEVMTRAKLTRGAFYSHFSSKSELYREALLSAAAEARDIILAVPDLTPTMMANHYLNIGRGEGAQEFCVLAFLVSDINQRDKDIRQTYTRILNGYIGLIENTGLENAAAIQATVLLVGGLALSRAVTDDSLQAKILDNCQKAVENLQLEALA
ncbi:TetR/AcrR family transcriptional regulator [Agaribacterium sp. ZY112]|uniref:TetR/AcrR family transcriptional regulator n=1 Tax=Agaribacterium sp. ZY112 TaxID=3233574 RepID=UPI003526B2A3